MSAQMNDDKSNNVDQSNSPAFAFVQALAVELSAGKVDIPSFPDIVARVRQVLSDEFVSSKQIVRVVSAEPALAGKLLLIANSVALNPGGARIIELKSAITRIGLNMVRSASLSFAMEQMRKSESLAELRAPMTELWERSVLVAAMSYVVAKRFTNVNPDTALLAGLMHGMGKLYLLTRASQFPLLFKNQPTYKQIVRDWHANIAKAILENWEINDDIVVAIEEFENLDRTHIGANDLTDVLTVANLLASFHEFPESIELNMQGVKACERMKLDREAVERILGESSQEVASLRAALGT
jgi:HD-like signal output (HDOD) protein